MNPTTGLSVPLSFRKSAAASSAFPPISPIMMIPCVSGSLTKRSKQSMKFVPLKGSPPMPTYRQYSISWQDSGRLPLPEPVRRVLNKAVSHHGRLAQSLGSGLENCFVRECARPRDNTNFPRCVNITWHDSNLTLTWLDDARAVGANKPCLASISHCLLYSDLQTDHDGS